MQGPGLGKGREHLWKIKNKWENKEGKNLLFHFLDSVYVCYAAKSSEMCTNSLSVMGRK